MKYIFCVLLDKQMRVDIYMSALFQDFSRSYIQKMIDRGQLSVNGKVLDKNLKIKNKDEVILEIKNLPLDISPEKMDLDIIFEDDNLLILNKDAGINVHPVPGESGNSGTIVNGILHHCKNNLPSIGGVERPGIVHRLDKDTSGIMLIAKSDIMMNYLSGIIKERKIDKYYIAIVSGIIKDKNIKIESFIGRDKNDRKRMTTIDPVNPKIALTKVEVLDYIDNKYTVVRVKLETGRTHQIRVHLSSIGYPIIGDKLYGNEKVNKEVNQKYGLKRQALHALELKFDLYSKTAIFKAELKPDMKKIFNK